MRYKKIMILTILLITLLAISPAIASENVTDNTISVDDSTNSIDFNDYVISTNDMENELNEENMNILKNSDSQDVLLVDNNSDILSLSSPPSSYYDVYVYDTTIYYESGGSISMSIEPCEYNNYYSYDFYLKIYDSNNVLKVNQEYYSSYGYSETYTVTSHQLSPGTYTIKIINYYDNIIMDTATLTVKSSSSNSYTYPPHSTYSVSVYDTTINYGSSGTISMSISPASSSYKYKYDYYLKIYDSNNNLKVNTEYYSTTPSYSRTYSVDSNSLSSGTYTIRIVNYYDNVIMDTAILTVKSSSSNSYTYPSYSTYSVSVYDTTINYGSSGTISMSISPASSSYKNKYDYYLRVFDSNNHLKINQRYYSTNYGYSKAYSVGSSQLSPGTYNIMIVNYKDDMVMCTAKLTVKSSTTKTTKIFTKVIAPKVTAKKGESKTFKITIKNKANNKAVKNVKISVKVGNKNYNLITNSKGVASLNTKSLKVGTHQVTIKSKNSKYKISAKSTIVIKKLTKTPSNYKIITTTAKEYWITKKSDEFTVQTKIWDMTAGIMAPYKYIDTTLYKNGKQMTNTKYSVNYKVNGKWTGWQKYGTTSTAHHRYSVEDSASVNQIKVKVHK